MQLFLLLATRFKMPKDFHHLFSNATNLIKRRLSLNILKKRYKLNQDIMESIMEMVRDTMREVLNQVKTRCTSLLAYQYVLKFIRRLLHILTRNRKMSWRNS